MNFLKKLRVHVGGLVRLKNELYWYNPAGWDGIKERVCLLLDTYPAADLAELDPWFAASVSTHGSGEPEVVADFGLNNVSNNGSALLLIDGSPKWVWVSEKYMELIQ
jgi:hypothetical protein